jgi:hypothetical protein
MGKLGCGRTGAQNFAPRRVAGTVITYREMMMMTVMKTLSDTTSPINTLSEGEINFFSSYGMDLLLLMLTKATRGLKRRGTFGLGRVILVPGFHRFCPSHIEGYTIRCVYLYGWDVIFVYRSFVCPSHLFSTAYGRQKPRCPSALSQPLPLQVVVGVNYVFNIRSAC